MPLQHTSSPDLALTEHREQDYNCCESEKATREGAEPHPRSLCIDYAFLAEPFSTQLPVASLPIVRG